MLMKSVKGSLAFLISISLLALVVPFSAQADVTNQPQINYSDNTGLSFAVAPASISGLKNAKLQWFVNGKAVSGATKLSFKATAKQRGQRIEFRETRANSVSASVTAKIGQIIVNIKPKVSYNAESANTASITAGLVSPKASKVAYQWYKGPIDIAGAKSITYNPATADQGFKIYVN